MVKPTEAAHHFGVTRQTLHNWAKRFAAYLSAGAGPGTGQEGRTFTSEDMQVLALIHNYTANNRTYDDARAALDRGERGHYTPALTTETDTFSSLTVDQQALFIELKADYERLAGRIRQLEIERDVDKKSLADKDREIAALNRQLGKLELMLELAEKRANQRKD